METNNDIIMEENKVVETEQDQKAVPGPVPTEVLNPSIPITDKEESDTTKEESATTKEEPHEIHGDLGSLFGCGDFQDYKPLFDKYTEIFKQQEINSNYLKKCIDLLNLQLGKARRASWLAILIGTAAIILSIIKR